MCKYFLVLIYSLLLFNCTKSQSTLPQFNDTKWDTIVVGKGPFIGHEINMNGKIYVGDKFFFNYLATNEEFNFLCPEIMLIGENNSERRIVFWHNVSRPYKLTKEKDADHLIIEKGGRKFIFKREKRD